jgi:hypothetical protein
MHRLTDAYDNSIVVSNDVMREIVRNIDSYIGSSEYHEKFIEHKGANYTGRRIEAVMNNCVIPVCNRVGVSI